MLRGTPSPEHTEPPWPGWVPLALVLGVWLIWLPPSWNAGWSFDDRQALVDNPIVTGQRPALDAFQEDFWHHQGASGLYRPLVTLSFRWQREMEQGSSQASLDAPLLHRTNVLLHWILVGLAVRLWCWPQGIGHRASPSRWAWGVALLFAWHPVQSEAVLWVSGRSISLAAAFGLSAWALWRQASARWHPCIALAGTVLPLLAKEEGLAFSAVFWVLAGASRAARSSRFAVLVGLGMVLGLRAWALGNWGFGEATGGATAPPQERLLDGARAWGIAMAAMVIPTRVPLSVPPGSSHPDSFLWPLLGWMGLGALLVLAARTFARTQTGDRKDPLQAQVRAGWAGLAVAILPWTQCLPTPETFGLRMLYLPLLFGIPIAAGSRLRWHKAWAAIALLLLGWSVVQVRQIAPAFQSPLGFWTYRAQREPHRALVWNGLGNEQFARGQLGAARDSFSQALECEPSYSRPWVGLALIAEREGDLSSARGALRSALQRQPKNAVAHANLARLLASQSPEDCLHHWKQAVLGQPGRALFWRGLAGAQWRMGARTAAREAVRRALELAPGDPELLRRAERYKQAPLPSDVP